MREVMRAEWKTDVSKLSGERYTCDICKKVIFDTTQIEEEFINRQEKIPYFSVTFDSENKHACSASCAHKLFNLWNSRFINMDETSECFSPFYATKNYIDVNRLLDKYAYNELTVSPVKTPSLKEWNAIKKEKSSPDSSST